MVKRLFVGNLSDHTGEEDLRKLFDQFGEVSSVSVPTDRTGRGKRIGVVQMDDDADAEKAIEALNGREFNGRSLKVEDFTARRSR